MTKIHFYIHYYTSQNQHIAVEYYFNNYLQGETSLLQCHTFGQGHWMGQIELEESDDLYYRYLVTEDVASIYEAGQFRKVNKKQECNQLFLHDHWRDPYDSSRIFESTAFTEVIFKPERQITGFISAPLSLNGNKINFQLNAPDIPPATSVGITGSDESLGEWKKAIPLESSNYPMWKREIEIFKQQINTEFKYVLCDAMTGEIISWEDGENRVCNFNFPDKNGNCLYFMHEGFRHSNYRWRGTGIAIPVFSLRTKRGLGIGEFNDLKKMIDLASEMGMNFLQILPVNDTIAAKTYKDSYPYSAISVFALHPLYVNIDAVGVFKNKKDVAKYEKERNRLNDLEQVDIVDVINVKMVFLRILYFEKKNSLFRTKEYKNFFQENEGWLVPYAAFCHLRDINGTADFQKWENYNVYKDQEIKNLTRIGSDVYEEVAFYYFLQFHADKQLKDVKNYGRQKRVVLKGDLPIGVYRYSCDAWVSPDLYNMDGQSGAPPDDYAEDGQNWGFPTYNWERMAEDNFLWWRKRMKSLAKYFDALRIDHILGFFRIWEIPINQVSGILGKFNPRLPVSEKEISNYGLHGNLDRYTQPYIRESMLLEIFGADCELVKKEFLQLLVEGEYKLKANVNTQAKILQRFELKKYKKYQHLISPLLKLVGEVLLLEEPGSQKGAFNPRISFHKSFSYKSLSDEEKIIFDALYNDYFYVRHNDYWKDQALWKLPALLGATDMLICGEDLGMIPGSVPGVMKDLHIISLEIQRMPKGPTAFGVPSQYDYMTVCSPSCHDMSTIRGWWESDHSRSQKFYNHHMQRDGYAPIDCPVDIVKYINQEHLNSPSAIAIFPLQDLLGMDEKLRKEDADSEQINDPANSNHYWRYRMHLDIESLLNEKSFLDSVKYMVVKAGR